MKKLHECLSLSHIRRLNRCRPHTPMRSLTCLHEIEPIDVEYDFESWTKLRVVLIFTYLMNLFIIGTSASGRMMTIPLSVDKERKGEHVLNASMNKYRNDFYRTFSVSVIIRLITAHCNHCGHCFASQRHLLLPLRIRTKPICRCSHLV